MDWEGGSEQSEKRVEGGELEPSNERGKGDERETNGVLGDDLG